MSELEHDPHGAEERLRKFVEMIEAWPESDEPAKLQASDILHVLTTLQQERERAGKDCESCEAAGVPCLVHLPKWGADLLARAESAERERDTVLRTNRVLEGHVDSLEIEGEAAERDARVLRRLEEYAKQCQREGRESLAHQAMAIWATGVLQWIAEAREETRKERT